MAKIDISGFPINDYIHERYGLPVFALRNRTELPIGTVLFGIMLRDFRLNGGDIIRLIADGEEYACPILNIAREADGNYDISDSPQQIEAGEILHLVVPTLALGSIKTSPVLVYADKTDDL